MMLVQWKWGNCYDNMWLTQCRYAKVSPNAVYEARPTPTEGYYKIITGLGLRLVTVSDCYLNVVKTTTRKQLKDFF